MSDTMTPQQQSRTLSAEALQALYTELGAKTHEIYELRAELARAKALLQEAMNRYGPVQSDGLSQDDGAVQSIRPPRSMRRSKR